MSDGQSATLRITGPGGATLLPLTSVRELAPAGVVTPLPGAPPAVPGLATVRGEVLPVVLAAPLEGAAIRCLAIVESRGVRFALGLHEVPRASAPAAHEATEPDAIEPWQPPGDTPPLLALDALAASVFDLAALAEPGRQRPPGEKP